MNKRRSWLMGLGSAAILGRAVGQEKAAGVRRVGVLGVSTFANEEATLKPFFDRMRELGWVEGRNIAYDRTYANDQHETLDALAMQLAARKPDLIYAPPPTAAEAARKATTTIPVVFAVVTDPVAAGLVASLARPGGNVTGISSLAGPLMPKRMEILREIMPRVKKVGLLHDPTDRNNSDRLTLEALPGLKVVAAAAANPAELDAGLANLVREKVEVIMLAGTPLMFNFRRRILEACMKAGIPAVGHRSVMVDEGALFTYGSSLAAQLRASASQVDKVLKGAKPADLPVEQPTIFELVVNMKMARAFNLRIPQTVLLRADRVVE